MNRILDISDNPARLRVERSCLCIEVADRPAVTLPIKEVAALIFSNPQISCTQAVLSELAACGGVVITCDSKRLPVGMQLPLQSHFVQGERFQAQSQVKVPLRKRLWQAIVQSKIRQQGLTLKRLRGTDAGLIALAGNVQSGDTSNVEAQAARRYWQQLFPGTDFHRDRELIDQNQHLNYGYAILRAITARAICGVGLHPSLGLHHHNRYNAFCLADDLMEPFRPAVDFIVAKIADESGDCVALSSENRRRLLEALYQRWKVDDEKRSLFEAVEMLASSVVDNFMGVRRELRLPTQLEPPDALPAR